VNAHIQTSRKGRFDAKWLAYGYTLNDSERILQVCKILNCYRENNMKRKNGYVGVGVLMLLGLLLILTLRGLAQESGERVQPQGVLEVEALVNSTFTYQGMLREDGAPVSGTRDMVFQLFSDDACTVIVGSVISMPGVAVNEGVFSVELTVSSSNFNGQGLWLGIQIEGTTVGCQEILPVPYALSLRPGASIEGEQVNWDALHVVNTVDTGQSYGVYARSYSTLGRGVYAYASASSGSTYGVYGRSNSADGAGIYARGLDAGADLILGGNANTLYGDDGRIMSDPNYPSSDLYLITNDGVRIDLDADENGEDADFEIRNKDGTLIFNVDESGTITFGGTGLAAFPRPAYDSGWVNLGLGAASTRTHNLGGNTDNYVVDLTCKRSSGGAGVNNWGVGGDVGDAGEYYGGWWSNLTTTSIVLHRWNDDTDCPSVRVRIWMYP
jgi:hypothetical protein